MTKVEIIHLHKTGTGDRIRLFLQDDKMHQNVMILIFTIPDIQLHKRHSTKKGDVLL
jgi:hypothetical protein